MQPNPLPQRCNTYSVWQTFPFSVVCSGTEPMAHDQTHTHHPPAKELQHYYIIDTLSRGEPLAYIATKLKRCYDLICIVHLRINQTAQAGRQEIYQLYYKNLLKLQKMRSIVHVIIIYFGMCDIKCLRPQLDHMHWDR